MLGRKLLKTFMRFSAREDREVWLTGLREDFDYFGGVPEEPQFAGEALVHGLAKQRIAYRHLLELGERRGRPASDSPNTGWRVAQFAVYADHLQTEEFAQGLEALMLNADTRRSAMMCSEAVPGHCSQNHS